MKSKNFGLISRWIPPRPPEAHKGDFGHLLIVSGSRGMSGAAILAARAALRGGAGLVTVAAPLSQQPLVAVSVPEVLTLALPETETGSLSLKAADPLQEALGQKKINAIVWGPGLTTHPETVSLGRQLLRALELPLILDADGLNGLAGKAELLRRYKGPLVVTPHPGEMGRLIGQETASVQKNRVLAAKKLAKDIGGICVLKGKGTVVTDGTKTFVNSTGNPFLATGGTGDVLAGFLAALVVQWAVRQNNSKANFSPILFGCCQLAVTAHGLAADLAIRDIPYGLTAGDVVLYLPKAVKKIRGRNA